MAATYEPIATTTLSSNSSTVTFSSIPQTYTDLQLICNFKSDTTASHRLQFNSDATGNYANVILASNGSNGNAYSVASDSTGVRWASQITGVDASIPSMAIIDIFNYTNVSREKGILVQGAGSYYTSGGGYADISTALWNSASAITTLAFKFAVSALYSTGSTFTLFGIKAA
jgi:hypothetical protein